MFAGNMNRAQAILEISVTSNSPRTFKFLPRFAKASLLMPGSQSETPSNRCPTTAMKLTAPQWQDDLT